MSNSVSPAQRLPSDVVRLIIQYAVSETTHPHDLVDCYMDELREFLSVSSTWRQTALEYMWRELRLTVYNTVYSSRPKWFDYYWLPCKTENMVRELRINVQWASLFNGTACKLLLDYMGETLSLPFACKLHIKLFNDSDYPVYANDDAISNALMFAQFLRSLTPAVTLVDVQCEEQVFSFEEHEESVLREFLKSVYSGIQHTTLDMVEFKFRQTSTIDFIPSLTSLKLYMIRDKTLHIGLVRKCAGTLLQLVVEGGNPKALFYDDNNNVVVYPNLRDLVLHVDPRLRPTYMGLMGGIAPFPNLKRFVVPLVYPLDDDVLFRGNSTTLERLTIDLDKDTVAMLNKYRVFESKQKALRIVSIGEPGEDADLAHVPETETSKLLGNMLETVQILTIETNLLASRLIAAAQVAHSFPYIQKIDAPEVRLSLFDVLRLLKVLPALSTLTCTINCLGSELDHISTNDMPEFISSTYNNAGKNLQSWCVTSYNIYCKRDGEKYILLLALACPKLRRVWWGLGDITALKAKVAEALESEPFSQYPHLVAFLKARLSPDNFEFVSSNWHN